MRLPFIWSCFLLAFASLALSGCNFGSSTPPLGLDGQVPEFDAALPYALDSRAAESSAAADAPVNVVADAMDEAVGETDADRADAADGAVGDAAEESAPAAVTVSGTVSGLAGSGLSLLLNGANALAISKDGAFAFAVPLSVGASYAVTVGAEPTNPVQTCVVDGGTGVAAADVTNVAVLCTTDTFPVGGTVVGLASGTVGLTLANGTETVAILGNGPFVLPAKVASGQSYDVTVATNPSSPTQTCVVSGGMGTVLSAAVTSIVVNCATNSYLVGGTVSGLAGGKLSLANGSETITITANGTFSFATPVPSGTPYAVTVGAQPTTPSQTCVVAAGSGTVANVNVTSVAVTCSTNLFSLGGTVAGLAGTGLVLESGTGQSLAVTANGAFTFATPLPSGTTYALAVGKQPSSPSQICKVGTNASGTLGGANVAVAVTCQTSAFTVGGMITGLAGTGLVLSDNGGAGAGNTLDVAGTTAFTFATAVASGAAYDVEVATQPTAPSQSCVPSGNKGTVGNGPVSTVVITCETDAFPISGTITGLAGTGLELTDGTKVITPTSSTFAFAALPSGTAYNVQVVDQPTRPTQVCSVTASGTIGAAAVTGVVVTCVTRAFPISGTIVGLAGTGLELTDGTNGITPASSTFAFAALPSGTAYNVQVVDQPTGPTQVCSVTASGTIGAAAVTGVVVTCVTQAFPLTVAISGLEASTGALEITDGVDKKPVAASGSVTFPTSLPSGTAYAFSVESQPTGPNQTCVVTSGNATGAVTTGPVTIDLACAPIPYTVSVVVSNPDCEIFTPAGLELTSFTVQGGTGTTCPVPYFGDGNFATTQCDFTYPDGTSYTISADPGPVGPGNGAFGPCTCYMETTPAGESLANLVPTVPLGDEANEIFGQGQLAGQNVTYDVTCFPVGGGG